MMIIRFLAVFFGLLLGITLAVTVSAESMSPVSTGDSWKFFLGTNQPPVGWLENDYNDSAWQQRPSGFSSGSTYGTLEASRWPPATNYHSVFLRKDFTIADPSSIRWLILRMDYSDGFVAYLNGHEITRRGLTNEPVAWNDIPSFHPGGVSEEFDVSDYTSLLCSERNVLAIQVHNATNRTPTIPAASSLSLVPELLVNFTRSPYIQSVTTNSVKIAWRTPFPASSSVEYGVEQMLGSETFDATLTTNHVLTLSNLLPETKYWYRVRSSSGEITVVSDQKHFRTFSESGPVIFHVIGDTGGQVIEQPTGIVPQYKLAQLMTERSADLVLHSGDLVYPDFRPGREDTHLLSVYGTLMHSVPIFPTMGNHEFDEISLGESYLDTFFLPTNNVTGTEHFYSFDHGDVHFVSLFVPQLNWGGVPPNCGCLPQYALTNGSLQYSWLTNDLATSQKPWKVLLFHVPINNSGNHRFDDYNQNEISDRIELQELLYPIASKYGVQLILNGHDHGYERFNPTNGVYSIVSGGGGGPLPQYFYPRDLNSLKRDAGSSQFHLAWHFLTVSIDGDTLQMEAIGTNGLSFDSMTIRRTPPSVLSSLEASWNTPLIETIPANDARGNINNQTFDFIGTPLLTVGGEFSNLGRVFINNDATNLYIGFDQVMLNENNNIFVFLETHLTGISNLQDTGFAPTQGVNGLVLLKNLGFTNFNPSVAMLLGDEYADSSDSLFSRPDLSLTNLGQGVFLLNSNLQTIPSARLQQFNRSPQRLEPAFQLIYPERNANFIEVSIPFAELGNIQPGDTIKLAAIVGGAAYDSQLETRQLDTSFLGESFQSAGLSNAIITGLSVRLALDPSGDEDLDGLPNGWEITNNLNPRSVEDDDGALGNPDHDGMDNLAEFIAGTDPRDATSFLSLRIQDFSPSHVVFSWDAKIGKHYQLETASNMLLFTNHPSDFFPRTAVSNTESFLEPLTNGPTSSSRFYRLRVSP